MAESSVRQIKKELKAKNQNINVRELFRQNLEYAEVIPDPDLRSRLMRKVARKEFLHFNLARLNIFYIGGIFVAGITAAVLLHSVKEKSALLITSANSYGKEIADTVSYLQIPVPQPVKEKPVISESFDSESIRPGKIARNSGGLKAEPSVVHTLTGIVTPSGAHITSSFYRKSLFPEAKTDTKKLRNEPGSSSLHIEPSISAGCAPLRVKFGFPSTIYDSCRWTFGDGGYSNVAEPEWIFDVEGDYKVVLDLFMRDGRQLSSTASVTVYPKPKARFEISPSKGLNTEDEIRIMNYSTDAVQFSWDFGDGTKSESFEPKHTYVKDGSYNVRLVAYSDLGCTDSVTVSNALSASGYFIDFPNAFIPNTQGPSGGYYSSKSDEAAQVFHPSLAGVSEFQLKIFSKLGIQIFESNDINLGWDGYNNGQLCEPGVYIWKVRGKFRNGEAFIKMGDVTLLKN
jgi:PKD domain